MGDDKLVHIPRGMGHPTWPYKQHRSREKRIPMTLTIHPRLHDEVKREARRRRISRSHMVELALEAGLDALRRREGESDGS